MRIAYTYLGAPPRIDGVIKKILDQVSVWSRMKHEVCLFLLVNCDGPLPPEFEEFLKNFPQITVRRAGLFDIRWPLRTLKSRAGALRELSSEIQKFAPDVIYRRFGTHYPSVDRLAKKFPLILEVQSNDLMELRKTLSTYKYLYRRLTREKLLHLAKGAVYITHELSRISYLNTGGGQKFVLGDGIQFQRISSLAISANAQPYPRLFFMGTPDSPWHGLDKLLELAQHRPQWKFDIVGTSKEYLKTLKGTFENVEFHGFLGERQYNQILACADVAISSLALDRIPMKESSPLKTREYLASGIPTILGYKDTDFSGQEDFVLQLPAGEANVREALAAIDKFVLGWMGRRVPRDQVKHLDSEFKESLRLNFLAQQLTHSRDH